MNNQQLEIVNGLAFIYDKLKLIVTQPVGITKTTRKNLDIKKEAMFLSGGANFAFPCEALSVAYQNLEAIQSYLGKPNREIPIVINVLDANTEENVDDIYDEFTKEYNVLEKYIKEDYKVKSLPCVYHNIEDYAMDSNKLEELNILNIEKDEFSLIDLIYVSKNSFESVIGEGVPNFLRKSRLVDNVFVANESEVNLDENKIVSYIYENNSTIYVPFACYDYDETNKILYADKKISINNECDLENIKTGNVDLGYGNSIGYLIETNNEKLTIKIANYVNYTTSGQSLVTVIEDTGCFKEIMKNYINEFICDTEDIKEIRSLLNEAKDLLIEFSNTADVLGFNIIKEVSVDEYSSMVYVTFVDDEVQEFDLGDVARICRSLIDGNGLCSGVFDEEVHLRICDIENNYKNKGSKEEFINYVGSLYYAKYRCEEIYNRLQDIENKGFSF